MSQTEVAVKLDVSQKAAKATLSKAKGRIARAVKAMEGKAYAIGSELNVIKAEGTAVSAYTPMVDDKLVRDFSEDGRKTSVSKFVDTIKGLSRQDAFKYMSTAQRIDELEAAGIPTAQFVDSTFRSVEADTNAADFVAVVEGLLDDPDTKKVTAKAFTDAGREAGIVKKANVGGGGDKFLKALNAALVEANACKKMTSSQKAVAKRLVKALADIG